MWKKIGKPCLKRLSAYEYTIFPRIMQINISGQRHLKF